jgi:hypothetical protein
METDNKYYTPEITEFRPGFEFEAYKTKWAYPVEYLGDNKCKVLADPKLEELWCKETYLPINYMYREDEDTIIDDLEDEIKNNKVRVKYLDKQDIEELGWQPSPNKSYWFNSFKGDNEKQLYFDDKIREKNQGLGVTIYDGETNPQNDDKVFNGFIKNKSELEVLMKQLGI